MAQKKFSDLSKIAELEKTDILAIERADGTKQVSFKQLCNAIAVQQIEELVDELPEIEEDDTLSKIAGKINKWQKDALKKIEGLTGNVSGVDILDSKEEIEANTESGKAAGAQALKEMFDAINSNMADGQIAFSIVDGEPYVKVGADAPRPFNGDCVINIPGTVELYGYDNGAYKPLRAASIALKVQIRNRTATISSSASFSTSQYPGGWMGKVSFGNPSVTK